MSIYPEVNPLIMKDVSQILRYDAMNLIILSENHACMSIDSSVVCFTLSNAFSIIASKSLVGRVLYDKFLFLCCCSSSERVDTTRRSVLQFNPVG